MRSHFRLAIHVFSTAFFLLNSSTAQTSKAAELAAIPNAVQLTRRSGLIFNGTVVSVEKPVAPSPNDLPTVRITFRVEQGISGVRTGQLLVIREWAGLWDAGERYRPGERIMLFLYPPSRLGLTSPVGGSQGRFRLDRNGHVVLPPARISTPPQIPTTVRPPVSPGSWLQILRRMGRE